jgi:hypothetical protein
MANYTSKHTGAQIDQAIDIASTKFNGTLSKDIGGFKKGQVIENLTMDAIIQDLLFPYVSFTFSSISTQQTSTTYEYGTEITISKVTPNFTAGTKAINSVKVGTTSGGKDLYEGSIATNGTAITLTTPKSYNGATGGTIYCTLSDGSTTTTKSATVNYAYYTYYAVTDTTETPTSWTAVGNTSISDISIKANTGQYIWIASTGNYTGICQLNELSGKYNTPAATIKTSGQTLVNSKNYTCTNIYNFYRLESPRAANTNAKFKLGN